MWIRFGTCSSSFVMIIVYIIMIIIIIGIITAWHSLCLVSVSMHIFLGAKMTDKTMFVSSQTFFVTNMDELVDTFFWLYYIKVNNQTSTPRRTETTQENPFLSWQSQDKIFSIIIISISPRIFSAINGQERK